jgi:excisionase family DNA binding protein
MTERNDQNVLTIDEVAELHRVSRRTVERWIARGDLPASKLPGGLVRITRTDAESMLSSAVRPQRDGGTPFPGDVPDPVAGGTSDAA